jgi:hypothetical protein
MQRFGELTTRLFPIASGDPVAGDPPAGAAAGDALEKE